MKKNFYITTPIYYVNASPHIGHTYTTIAADVLARYHRMVGDKTFFATGTDEHGAKIEERAGEEKKDPQKFADEVAEEYKAAWKKLNILNDGFIRTTDKKHIQAVEKALQFMYDKGDIYKDKYEGLYCRGCEQFLNEKDLVDGKCPDHQTLPEKMSEETYMFKTSKYAKELLYKIKRDELRIGPAEKKNEIISFYEKEGLKDVSFSRKKVSWGIPLPWDNSHTAYVWSDAFLNYLTILGWTGVGGKHPEMFPPDVQLMSKDILRVHATIWPAMLLSLELPLPKRIFVHGFFMVDGQKMSKSLGNVIAPDDLIKKYGVDATRYLLMSATPFGHDGDISWQKFDEKYNADLANGIGNLVARTISMADKYFDKKVSAYNKVLNPKLKNEISYIIKQVENYIRNLDLISIDKAINIINDCIGTLDGYISANEPYKLIKTDLGKTAEILGNSLEGIRIIAIMLLPFMPETAEEILRRLGLEPDKEFKKDFKELIKWGGLPVGAKVKKGEPLFPRL